MQKFYTGAPACAQLHQEISIEGGRLSSPGLFVVPAVQASIDLGRARAGH